MHGLLFQLARQPDAFDMEAELNDFLQEKFESEKIPYRLTGIRELLSPFFAHILTGRYQLSESSPALFDKLLQAVEAVIDASPDKHCKVHVQMHSLATMASPDELYGMPRLKAEIAALTGTNEEVENFSASDLIGETDVVEGVAETVEERLWRLLDDEAFADTLTMQVQDLLAGPLYVALGTTFGEEVGLSLVETISTVIRIEILAALLEQDGISKRFRPLLRVLPEALLLGVRYDSEQPIADGEVVHFLVR